jgi:hypothetical protein
VAILPKQPGTAKRQPVFSRLLIVIDMMEARVGIEPPPAFSGPRPALYPCAPGARGPHSRSSNVHFFGVTVFGLASLAVIATATEPVLKFAVDVKTLLGPLAISSRCAVSVLYAPIRSALVRAKTLLQERPSARAKLA